MIEPFRPFVDYVVAKLSLSEASQLNAEIKNQDFKSVGNELPDGERRY